jgi:hypothetical protein
MPRGARCCALFFGAAVLSVFTPSLAPAKPAAASGGASTSYSGRALAFQIDGVTHPTAGPIVICDTGNLPASGGALFQQASDVSIADGALTIESAEASVTGAGPETLAQTALTNYYAHFITQDGNDVYITAAFIGATADVALNPGGHATGSASVTIEGLTVNGKAITVTGAANQIVDLPEDEVKLVLNEQVSSGAKGSGDVAVAAIHFYICECMEGHFGLVSAGISTTGTPPPPDHDECGKVTGGGWITAADGAKGTFGVSGGIRRGAYWGHLTYVDHGLKLKVESTAVTGFQVDASDANARIITYDVTINGAPGTATVRVADNGEPGRDDTFAITLSTGYSASGKLGGGNIQVHKCPPGWD